MSSCCSEATPACRQPHRPQQEPPCSCPLHVRPHQTTIISLTVSLILPAYSLTPRMEHRRYKACLGVRVWCFAGEQKGCEVKSQDWQSQHSNPEPWFRTQGSCASVMRKKGSISMILNGFLHSSVYSLRSLWLTWQNLCNTTAIKVWGSLKVPQMLQTFFPRRKPSAAEILQRAKSALMFFSSTISTHFTQDLM